MNRLDPRPPLLAEVLPLPERSRIDQEKKMKRSGIRYFAPPRSSFLPRPGKRRQIVPSAVYSQEGSSLLLRNIDVTRERLRESLKSLNKKITIKERNFNPSRGYLKYSLSMGTDFLHCPSPVADPVLEGKVHFRKRHVMSGRQKDRIITESAYSARFIEYRPHAGPLDRHLGEVPGATKARTHLKRAPRRRGGNDFMTVRSFATFRAYVACSPEYRDE